jgi:hypothetical protein
MFPIKRMAQQLVDFANKMVLRGKGEPEGKIVANRGVVYLDTTVRPFGVWLKVKGSKETGWSRQEPAPVEEG